MLRRPRSSRGASVRAAMMVRSVRECERQRATSVKHGRGVRASFPLALQEECASRLVQDRYGGYCDRLDGALVGAAEDAEVPVLAPLTTAESNIRSRTSMAGYERRAQRAKARRRSTASTVQRSAHLIDDVQLPTTSSSRSSKGFSRHHQLYPSLRAIATENTCRAGERG
jgi:hypothetical protein